MSQETQKLVTVTIDERQVQVPPGTTIIQAGERLGVEIPHYCYHPGLPIEGVCRMCLVEVEKSPKLLIACATPVAEGMVVHTRTPHVEEVRRGVLEFYLLNHPLDCPVCDKGGECPLQDYTMRYGPGASRTIEPKVHRDKHRPIGPHVIFDAERCILCTRCVRFCRDVVGTGELGIGFRGDRAEIILFPGRDLDNPYSGNVIDLCPVGALTSTEYRFKFRPWDLVRHVESTCPACSRGCSIVMDVRHLRTGGEEVLRIRPRHNPEVNGYWMCDEGRFEAYPRRGRSALQSPLVRRDDAHVSVEWDEAVAALAERLRGICDRHGPASVGGLLSTWLTTEELYAASTFLREVLGTPHLDYRVHPVQELAADEAEDHLLRRTDKSPNTRGARALGLGPGPGGWGTREMLEAARSGRLKALLLFEEEPWEEAVFADEWERSLDRLELLVMWAVRGPVGTRRADLVFPALGYAEKEGTIVNFAGRIQRVRKAIEPKGKVLPLGEVLHRVAVGLRGSGIPWTPEEIWRRLATESAAFRGIEYETIGPLGVPLTTGDQGFQGSRVEGWKG
ncbi:MAG TPA: molybdopterin-dependent oxidoreductase [Candidatus Methylomirabilis sp.]|nr:molybdopterin-dependent oxidoreductase [Candidatus Methylomirabilis sp.]